MYILLDDRNTVIEINLNIVRQENNNILVGNHLIYEENDMKIVEVDNVPIDILPMKYFYIDGEFVLNPNFVNPYSDKDVDQLKQEVKQLTTECSELNETILDLTDIIVENMNI